MPITINGTTGIAGVDGSASTPAYQGNDTNTGIFYPAADTIAFAEGGTEVMRIDSNGNVGIGTASPTQRLQIAGSQLLSSPGNSVYTYFDSTVAWVGRDSASGALVFGANSSERMRLDTSGNLLFNSGYGSVATAYGCRAWVKFNGTGTVAINGSGNVSSITDTGIGTYTVNFTTAMPDTNYSVTSIADDNGGNNPFIITVRSSGYVTSNIQIGVWVSGIGRSDPTQVNVAIFR